MESSFETAQTLENVQVNPEAAAAGVAAFMMVWLLFVLVLVIIGVVAMWKIFTKAGREGWKSIIPIYNTVVLLEIVGRPAWWVALFFIPGLNIIVSIIVMLDLAKSFGKSEIFALVALILFSFIGYLILAFGDARYVGPAGPEKGAAGTAAPSSAKA